MRLIAMPLLAMGGVVGALLLSGCGGGGSSNGGAANACALIAQPDALFGASAAHVAGHVDGATGACQWISADARRGGDLIVYAAAGPNGATPAAQFAHFTESWDGMTETPLAPLAGVGDEAQVASDLPGGQTQIVIRKGDKVAILLAWSGDPAMSGDALARAMAQAAASRL